MTTKSENSFIARHLSDFVLLLYVVAVTVGAFTGGSWAALGMGGALILFFCVLYINRWVPIPEKNVLFLTFAFFIVAGCLNFNSYNPDVSWEEWRKLTTIFFPLCLLSATAIQLRVCHPKFFTIMPIAICIGGIGLAICLYIKARILAPQEAALTLPHYNRGFSYLMMISFPVMAGLWFSNKRWLIVPFFLLLLIPASLSESRSSKLALLLAMFVILIAHFWPVFTRRMLVITPFVTIGWAFGASWIFVNHHDWLSHIPASFLARMEIWDYMSYRIMERPWLGWGLGTAPTLPFAEPHGAQYVFTVMPAAHPHNVMTELWVELGIPGLILGIIFALLILRKARKLDLRIAPFAMGAWVAGYILCLIAYNFWTDSMFAAFALTGLAFIMLERKLKLSRSSADAPANP